MEHLENEVARLLAHIQAQEEDHALQRAASLESLDMAKAAILQFQMQVDAHQTSNASLNRRIEELQEQKQELTRKVADQQSQLGMSQKVLN